MGEQHAAANAAKQASSKTTANTPDRSNSIHAIPLQRRWRHPLRPRHRHRFGRHLIRLGTFLRERFYHRQLDEWNHDEWNHDECNHDECYDDCVNDWGCAGCDYEFGRGGEGGGGCGGGGFGDGVGGLGGFVS